MARLLLRDLTPGTTYKIQLRARDGDSASEWSRLFTLSTTSDTTPPDVPAWAVSSAFITAGDTFVATWQDVDRNLDQNKDFDHYEVWFSNGTTSYVFRTTNTSYTLTFAQNKLLWNTPQATVYSQVRSVDQVGNVSAWSSQKSATNAAPSAPGTIGVTALYDSIKVTWSTVTDDDLASYKLQVSTNGTTWSDIYNGTDTMFIHNTTLFTTDHTFRVYAVDKFGTVSSSPTTSGTVRPKSAFAIDTTPPSAPSTFTATGGFDTTNQQSYFDLSWSAVSDSDLDVYIIRYGTDNSHWQYITVPRENTSFRLNVDPSKSYYLGVTARDLSGNLQTTYTTPTPNPTSSTADTSAPSTPQNPAVVSNTMQAQVTATGKKADGVTAMETDVAFYEVYASTTTGFTPAAANMVGTIAVGPAMVGTFDIPTSGGGSTQTWYFKVIAVDRAGNKSGASSQTTATPGLIAATNIVNATITNAQINNVNADQITAGSGFINNLTVKSTLTIGNATTAGAVQSFDYVANTTGWKISTNAAGVSSFEVNGGSISAAALLIQNGANIINPVYSDFESYSDYTTLLTVVQGVVTPTIDNVSAKFGKQNLKLTFGSNTVDPVVYFGQSATDYNIPVTGGQTYILSAYAWVPGANATNVQLRIKWSDGTFSTAVSSTVAASGTAATSTRLSGTVTAPSGATGGVMFIQSSTHTAEAVQIDGVQVEVKQAALNTPSTWKPGTSTTIDGGTIKTGKIQSSTSLTLNSVTLPTWMIDTNGNAVFGNALFRGSVIVGYDTAEDVSGANTDPSAGNAGTFIKSANYSPRQADGTGGVGWILRSDGTAEFGAGMGGIDGSVIIDGTLDAASIQTGTLLAGDITLDDNGAINAYGPRGENIGLSSDGFYVFGPFQVPIYSYAITSNVATITTTVNHGFSANNIVTIQGLPDPFNDTFTITSVTSNTFSFAVSNADISTTLTNGVGIALSDSSDPNIQQPTLINFPTDGANPNIISGVLSADTLTVNTGATFRGINNIEQRATMLIASSIIAPKSGPTLSANYNDKPMTGKSIVAYGFTRGHNGNWFVVNSDTNNYYIQEFNGTTGAFIATRLTQAKTVKAGNVNSTFSLNGIVWNQSTSSPLYYVAQTQILPGSIAAGRPVIGGRYENINTYDSSWTNVSGYNALFDQDNNNGWKSSGIGWDYVNSRPIYTLHDGTNLNYYYITLNGSGYPSSKSGPTAVSGGGSLSATQFITRTATQIGNTNDRVYIRSRQYVSGSDTTLQRYLSYNTSNARQTAEEWPAPYNVYTQGVYFDPSNNKFYQLSSWGIQEFQGNDSYWATTSMTSKIWVGYSWYDSVSSSTFTVTNKALTSNVATITTSAAHGLAVGQWVEVTGVDTTFNGVYKLTATTSNTLSYAKTASNVTSVASGGTVKIGIGETDLSPRTSFDVPKRSMVKVGISKIPWTSGVADVPDSARIYAAYGSTQPTYSATPSTSWHLRATITQPAVSGTITPVTGPNDIPPLAAGSNSFAGSGTPGIIQSTTGNSFWKGDDTAQFYQLLVTSPNNASLSSGNLPALRIGNTASNHWRIGDNAMYYMSNDTTLGFPLYYGQTHRWNYGSTGQYQMQLDRGTNYDMKIRTTGGTGAALVVINSNIVMATEGMDASVASLGTGNTVNLYALAIHSVANGLFMDDLTGGGTTGASIGNAGRITRTTSSLRYKDNVENLTLDTAKLALDLNAVTFQLKAEIAEVGADAIRYPGFIAEQADQAGLNLWVNYNTEGQADGFRYAELTAAHNMLIKDLYAEIAALEARVVALGG